MTACVKTFCLNHHKIKILGNGDLQRLFTTKFCLLGISLSCLHRCIHIICIWRSALIIFCFFCSGWNQIPSLKGLTFLEPICYIKFFKVIISLWPFRTVEKFSNLSSANKRNKANWSKHEILNFRYWRSTWDANWWKRINKVLRLLQNAHIVYFVQIGW